MAYTSTRHSNNNAILTTKPMKQIRHGTWFPRWRSSRQSSPSRIAFGGFGSFAPFRLLIQLVAFAAMSTAVVAAEMTAIPANYFLNSIGVNSAIDKRGEPLDKTIACAKYLGVRWFRAGIEGNVPIRDFIEMHQQAGVRFSWGIGSGGSDIGKLIETGRQVAAAGALLAFEGPNEPNNWGITYRGQSAGRNRSWAPVADLMRDLCLAVQNDPTLMKYPVWSISEGGAETDNVGLQFLTIPAGTDASKASGTKYADYANVHNYIYHPNAPGLEDNKTWKAADPSAACKVDGLYGEFGKTWAHHYGGYSGETLATLPRVTTETGCLIEGPVTEEIHARNILTMYLDQFKRGWSYTAMYLLRDRVDEAGNQKFGFYKPDYSPRKAALYLHNLTTILADNGSKRGVLDYSIPSEPVTVHDLLLQKDNGTFDLVVWDERMAGSDNVSIQFGLAVPLSTVYDPIAGVGPIRTEHDAKSIALMLSDHPMIIEVLTKY